MDTLVFLGTGDAMGVPRVYCSCETCTEAREQGKIFACALLYL